MTAAGADAGIDPGRFAALLCDWCLEVAPGQSVLVSATRLAEPLLDAVHDAILDRDAWPVMRMASPAWGAGFYAHARERHLDGHAPAELAELQAVDATLRIEAPENTAALSAVDPALLGRAAVSRAPVAEARRARRWALTQWPTPALAQQAGMATRDYARFVARALFLDRPDPIAAWTELAAQQQEIVARLSPARRVRIEADGTDLTLDVSGRTWINSDGRRNMPSGEVFTGPLEGSAEGTVRFTIPTGPPGVTVSGVALRFADGEVVDARAERGEDYLHATLATDAGAGRLGELGIGTNLGIDHPTGSILFDEKMAGTVHLALGRSYPETGGTNQSAIHWDLICDLRRGGRLTVDGEPLVVDGAFVA